jgi:hypothetical protein
MCRQISKKSVSILVIIVELIELILYSEALYRLLRHLYRLPVPYTGIVSSAMIAEV